MKTTKILSYIMMALVMTVFIGSVISADTVETTQTGLVLGMAVLFGSLSITEESGVSGVVIFDTVLEDWVGGANLNKARLPDGTTQVPAGTLLYILDGAAEPIKTATVITGGSATAIRVNKQHILKVGDVVMIETGSVAYDITIIDTTTSTDYDIITISTTLGVTPAADEVLVQAAVVTAGSDSAALHTANAVLKNTTNVVRANNSASGVVRGSVRSVALPYGAYADDIAALPLIRFA